MQLRNPSPSLCTTAGSGQSTSVAKFRVRAHETKTVLFPFVPLNIGESNVTISLYSSQGPDHLVQSVRVVVRQQEILYRVGLILVLVYSLREFLRSMTTALNWILKVLAWIFITINNTMETFAGLHVEGGPKCTFEAPKFGTLAKTRRQMAPFYYCYSNLDFRMGTCYRNVRNEIGSDSPMCGSPLPEVYTKTQCCDNEMPQFSMAWSAPGGQCELCKRRTEEFACDVDGVPGGLQQKNSFYTRLPENFVPGSETAWISCTGENAGVGANNLSMLFSRKIL